MADTKPPPAPDHPWRAVASGSKAIPISLAYATWSEDNYDTMELEAFVEKRS